MERDALDEELITEDLSRRERALDKEIIQLVQVAAKNDNSSRALELCKLFHNTFSFDMAVKVAEHYRLAGLQEKIELLKADREENEDRLIVARDKRRRWLKPDLPPRMIQTNDEASSSRPKYFQDFGPPPAIHRPGLAPAIPVVQTTRYSSMAPPLRTPTALSRLPSEQPGSSNSPDGKRKRDADEDDSFSVDEPESSLPPPPKHSKDFLHIPLASIFINTVIIGFRSKPVR